MYLRWLVGYLNEKGIRDKEIDALARMALMKYEAPLKWRFRRRSSKLFRRMGSLLNKLRRC